MSVHAMICSLDHRECYSTSDRRWFDAQLRFFNRADVACEEWIGQQAIGSYLDYGEHSQLSLSSLGRLSTALFLQRGLRCPS